MSLSLVAVVVLLLLLAQKELFRTATNPDLKKFSQILDPVLLPLLITFGIIVLMKVFNVR